MDSNSGSFPRRRRKAQADTPTDVSVLLQGVLAGSLLGERMDSYTLVTHWKNVVGERMVAHLQVLDLQGNTLVLHASSGPWLAEANLQKKAIIEGCNALLGKNRVRELRFA